MPFNKEVKKFWENKRDASSSYMNCEGAGSRLKTIYVHNLEWYRFWGKLRENMNITDIISRFFVFSKRVNFLLSRDRHVYMTWSICRVPCGWQPFITSNRPSSHFRQTSCSLHFQYATQPHDRKIMSCSLTMVSTRCGEMVTLFSSIELCSR